MRLSSIWHQFRSLLPIVLAIYLPTLGLLGLILVISLGTGIPVGHFTRDPIQIVGGSRYTGVISNLGVLLWCSSATICLLSSAIVRRKTGGAELSMFLLFSGLLTSGLLFDDFFLVHEKLSKTFIPEEIMFIGYAVVVLVYLVRFSKVILQTEFILLLFALGFFGLSIVTDLSPIQVPENPKYLVEDGSKLLGIVSWFTYFTRVCLTHT
jgi:hypothetical protein